MSTPLTAQPRPALGDYFVTGIVLALWSGALLSVVGRQAVPEPQAERLIGPMLALVGLTALVWLGMVLARNLAILAGRASVAYYADYVTNAPDEVIERPARTFNNLMQLPNLFYVVCLLMLVTKRVDQAQITLAWLFVAARAAHALIYIALNKVPYRFTARIASCIVLGTLWWGSRARRLGRGEEEGETGRGEVGKI